MYFYRNLVYDAITGGPLKFIDTPAGVLVYQNTFVGQGRLMRPASNVHFLNNLFLGDGYLDPVFILSTYTNYSTSDYNGFRPNPGVNNAFEWDSPAFEVAADYEHDPVTRHFKSLEEYQHRDAPGTAQRSDRLRCFRESPRSRQARPATSL